MQKKSLKNLLNTNNLSLPFEGDMYTKSKRRISLKKLFRLMSLSVASVGILAIVSSLSLSICSQKTSAEVLTQEDVVSNLSKIIILPKSEDLISVERVGDATSLKSSDEFFKDIKDGDYLIKYKDLFFIYDYNHNFIKNVLTKK